MACSNDKCNRDAYDSLDVIVVTVDGDAVCNKHCQQKYEKQKARFFGEIINDDTEFNSWILGEI